jgi:low-density lipoprotein receptor class A
MRSLLVLALTVVLVACGSSAPSNPGSSAGSSGGGGSGGGGGSPGGGAAASSAGGTAGQAGGTGAGLGTGATWGALPAGDGERAKTRTAACEAQCQTDGGCGFWDAASCVRHCADPRLACQADLAPDACWAKMSAFATCQASLSCAELNQFYYHASEGGRPCESAADELEATCGFVELVASEQCYGPSLTCSDGSKLSPYWVCDGDNDCPDGADEGNCPWLTSGPQSTCLASANIDGNDSAGDIAALAGVTCINGVLDIRGSTLADLSGLESLTTVRELRIGPAPALSFGDAGNPALVSLHGLEHLKGVQAVSIEGNPVLTDLSALSGLTFVTGDLEVVDNNALASLDGLHNIARAGDVKISGNAALTSLAGLRGLTAVDGFTLSQNALLKNFEGMEALTYFGPTGLYVGNNAALVDFSGLKVAYIGADFNVVSNAALTSLKGLESVTLLAWTVSISQNPMLASIGALSAVTEIRGDVSVSTNPLLPTCQVNALLTPLGKTCACSGNDDAATCDP